MKALAMFILALILLVVLTPLALLFRVVTPSVRGDWFYRLTLSIDQFGNVLGDSLFNFWLLKDKGHIYCSTFGNEDETISSVIGKNFNLNNLSKSGELLRQILSYLENNHSVNSIEKDEG